MRSLIKYYLGLNSRLLYLISAIISVCIAIFGRDCFSYLAAVMDNSGLIISEETVYLFSPLQCAAFLIPGFLISFYMAEKKIEIVELIVEPRLNDQAYIGKNIMTHLLNCLIYAFITALFAYLTEIILGKIIPIIFLLESVICKVLYFVVLSLLLEIMKIFRIKMIVACAIVYVLAITEYILTYSYKVIYGILFPYAVYRINWIISYIFLVLWLIIFLGIYVCCRIQIQEFVGEK